MGIFAKPSLLPSPVLGERVLVVHMPTDLSNPFLGYPNTTHRDCLLLPNALKPRLHYHEFASSMVQKLQKKPRRATNNKQFYLCLYPRHLSKPVLWSIVYFRACLTNNINYPASFLLTLPLP